MRLILVFVTIFFMSLPLDILGQEGRGYFYKNTDRIFYGGLSAGFNFSAINGDNYDGYHKLGFNGGAIVYGRVFRRLLLSVEILYTMKGCRGVRAYNSYYSGTFFEKYYLDLNYAEVPVIAHFLINDKWSVGLGGAYAQLLKSKEDILTDQAQQTIDQSKYPFNKKEYSIVLSGGMQIYRGWFLSLRYQNSLQTIRDYTNIPIGLTSSYKWTNSLFSLKLTRLIN